MDMKKVAEISGLHAELEWYQTLFNDMKYLLEDRYPQSPISVKIKNAWSGTQIFDPKITTAVCHLIQDMAASAIAVLETKLGSL